MIIDVALFLFGLVLLYYGAEFLVSAASSMAFRLGITPIIVGCTVVAFGTSAPELVVSLAALSSKNDGVSIGNIVGSNIANLLLILGMAAVIRPIDVNTEVLKREYPIMLVALAFLVFFGFDGLLSRWDGALLFAGMVAYMAYQFVAAKRAMVQGKQVALLSELDEIDEEAGWGKNTIFLIGGVIGLALGAKMMVDSAVSIAHLYAIPDFIIGVSIVAIGTSLPELATSVIAAMKGKSDISLGNVVGSNVFNTLLVLGVVASFAQITIGEAARFDMWVMMGAATTIWVLMFITPRITRIHGIIFLSTYAAFMVSLFYR